MMRTRSASGGGAPAIGSVLTITSSTWSADRQPAARSKAPERRVGNQVRKRVRMKAVSANPRRL